MLELEWVEIDSTFIQDSFALTEDQYLGACLLHLPKLFFSSPFPFINVQSCLVHTRNTAGLLLKKESAIFYFLHCHNTKRFHLQNQEVMLVRERFPFLFTPLSISLLNEDFLEFMWSRNRTVLFLINGMDTSERKIELPH